MDNSLLKIGLLAIMLIVATVLGLYIVQTVENTMINAGFNSSSTWWTPYQNFVSAVKPSFTLLGVAVIVMIIAVVLFYLFKILPEGR